MMMQLPILEHASQSILDLLGRDVKLARATCTQYQVNLRQMMMEWTKLGLIDRRREDPSVAICQEHLGSLQDRSITVVISHQPESFVNLLGNSRIMKFNEFWEKGKGPKIGVMSEKGFTTKDGKYNLEMAMVCDHYDSMILSKEGDAYRAIM